MKPKAINLMLLDGGLGDHIGSIVAVRYIVQRYLQVSPIVWLPDYLTEYAKNVLPSTKIYGFSQMPGRYNQNLPTKTTKWDEITSPMKIHCVDYAFLKLCDENPDIEHKNYVKANLDNIVIPELPKDYVVFTTGFTADVREWPANHVNATADWCIEKGFTPVFLGQTQTNTGTFHSIKGEFKDTIDFNRGINLINKTTLLQAMAVMQDAKAVLGVDNGLLHAAGCTDVPIIGGFTTVSPKIRMAIRHNILGHNYHVIAPPISLNCRFCQQNTNFLYGHDYRNCLYQDKRRNLCTTEMSADKFISKLNEVL